MCKCNKESPGAFNCKCALICVAAKYTFLLTSMVSQSHSSILEQIQKHVVQIPARKPYTKSLVNHPRGCEGNIVISLLYCVHHVFLAFELPCKPLPVLHAARACFQLKISHCDVFQLASAVHVRKQLNNRQIKNKPPLWSVPGALAQKVPRKSFVLFFLPKKFFHVLLLYNNQFQWILLGFNVTMKFVRQCEWGLEMYENKKELKKIPTANLQ